MTDYFVEIALPVFTLILPVIGWVIGDHLEAKKYSRKENYHIKSSSINGKTYYEVRGEVFLNKGLAEEWVDAQADKYVRKLLTTYSGKL